MGPIVIAALEFGASLIVENIVDRATSWLDRRLHDHVTKGGVVGSSEYLSYVDLIPSELAMAGIIKPTDVGGQGHLIDREAWESALRQADMRVLATRGETGISKNHPYIHQMDLASPSS